MLRAVDFSFAKGMGKGYEFSHEPNGPSALAADEERFFTDASDLPAAPGKDIGATRRSCILNVTSGETR